MAHCAIQHSRSGVSFLIQERSFSTIHRDTPALRPNGSLRRRQLREHLSCLFRPDTKPVQPITVSNQASYILRAEYCGLSSFASLGHPRERVECDNTVIGVFTPLSFEKLQ
jgi:hypothetical protein